MIDFIRVNVTESYSWPTFNLADVWLVVGVLAMAWWSWRATSGGPTPNSVGLASSA